MNLKDIKEKFYRYISKGEEMYLNADYEFSGQSEGVSNFFISEFHSLLEDLIENIEKKKIHDRSPDEEDQRDAALDTAISEIKKIMQ